MEDVGRKGGRSREGERGGGVPGGMKGGGREGGREGVWLPCIFSQMPMVSGCTCSKH